MGGRGAFVNVNAKNFNFVENGQLYTAIGEIDGVKVIKKVEGSVNAPEFSHTENRIYAVIQNGKLKHLAFYDENHKQVKSIDFGHPHGVDGLMPHVHFFNDHSKGADYRSPTSEELKIANKIKKHFGVE